MNIQPHKELHIDTSATQRERLEPAANTNDPALASLVGAWTGYLNPDGCHPLAYTYPLPEGMSQQDGISELAKRLPLSQELRNVDRQSFPDVEFEATSKNLQQVQKTLASLAQSESTTPDFLSKHIVPFLPGDPNNGFYSGYVTAKQLEPNSLGGPDAEFVAVVRVVSL